MQFYKIYIALFMGHLLMTIFLSIFFPQLFSNSIVLSNLLWAVVSFFIAKKIEKEKISVLKKSVSQKRVSQ